MTEEPQIRLIPQVTPEIIAEHRDNQTEWKRRTRVPEYLTDPHASLAVRDKLELADLLAAFPRIPHNSPQKGIVGNRAAEILARNGRFVLAETVAQDASLKALYADYEDALARIDVEKCSHYWPVHYEQGVKVENWFVEFRAIPSSKHNGERVPMLKCNVCGFRQMRPFGPGEEARFLS